MTTYTFNQVTKSDSVNYDREAFYQFVKGATKTPDGQELPAMDIQTWLNWLDAFYDQGDAQDLADTQADSLI